MGVVSKKRNRSPPGVNAEDPMEENGNARVASVGHASASSPTSVSCFLRNVVPHLVDLIGAGVHSERSRPEVAELLRGLASPASPLLLNCIKKGVS